MHATIEEEVVTDKEDTNDGENIFVQKKEGGVVDSNWVLLDSHSTVDQVFNLLGVHRSGSRQFF